MAGSSIPVIFAVGITKNWATPFRSFRTTNPCASPSGMDTRAQGAASPWARWSGTHWSWTIRQSACPFGWTGGGRDGPPLAPVFVLGRRFSGLVAIQPGHTLVTTGIYKNIRNPSYLGLLISCFGWALAFRSGTGLILAVLNIPPLVARMHSEEKLLLDNFGQDYARYRDRTARLIPGLY